MRLDELLATLGARPGLSGPHRRRAPRRPGDGRHPLGHPRLGGRRARHAVLLRPRPPDRRPRPRGAPRSRPGRSRCWPSGASTCRCPQLLVSSVRAAMGLVASAFHGDPSQRVPVVGVTGTNGKTTVCHLVASIFEASGRPERRDRHPVRDPHHPRGAPSSRPGWPTFARAGAAVAMEVSSHALVQHRVDGTRFAIAGFTNLSQDHLDYHGTMEAYFDAKARLFEPGRADRAVVCLDDPHGRLLRDAAQIPTVGYRATDAVRGGGRRRPAPRSPGAACACRRRWSAGSTCSNAIARGHDHRRARHRARRHREGPGRRVAGAGPLRAGRRRPAVPGGGRLRPHPRRARPGPRRGPRAGRRRTGRRRVRLRRRP